MKHFVTERNRTARRFIKQCNPPYRIDELEMVEIDRKEFSHIPIANTWLQEGHDVGLISESGMPSVADPGSDLISFAHQHNIDVIPLVGPSSIVLALSASGLNGQNFCFHGYLPIKDPQLLQVLKKLEQRIIQSSQTQIFIETPYRNDRMFNFLRSKLNPNIKLCLARDITGQNEFIKTRSIREWNKEKDLILGKTPCIFLLGK